MWIIKVALRRPYTFVVMALLVVDANNTIRTRAVKVGRDLGDKVEIISCLEPNDSLVANPTDAPRDGAEVKLQQPNNQETITSI